MTGKLNWLADGRTGVFPVATRLFSSPRQLLRGNRRDGSRHWSPHAKVGIRGPMAGRVLLVKRPAGCEGTAPAADSAVDAVQNKRTKRAHTLAPARHQPLLFHTHTYAHAALNIRFIYVLCSFFLIIFPLNSLPPSSLSNAHGSLCLFVVCLRSYTLHGTRHDHFLRIPCDVSFRVAR